MTTQQQVLNIINSELCTEVGPEEPLANLPMDSLDYLDLIVTLEAHSGKNVPNNEVTSFATVGGLMEFFGC